MWGGVGVGGGVGGGGSTEFHCDDGNITTKMLLGRKLEFAVF